MFHQINLSTKLVYLFSYNTFLEDEVLKLRGKVTPFKIAPKSTNENST